MDQEFLALRGFERNFINLTQMFDHVQMHTNKLYLDTFPFPFSIFEFNCSTVLKIISYYCLDFKPLLSTPKIASEIFEFLVEPEVGFENRVRNRVRNQVRSRLQNWERIGI